MRWSRAGLQLMDLHHPSLPQLQMKAHATDISIMPSKVCDLRTDKCSARARTCTAPNTGGGFGTAPNGGLKQYTCTAYQSKRPQAIQQRSQMTLLINATYKH